MRIVIVGAGKAGAFLAARLLPEHEVTLIEQRHERVERVRTMLPDANVIEGDACEPDVLERAGLQGADMLVASTGDDEDNLVVAMLAQNYAVDRVIARVNHPANEWLFDKEWGVDVAMSAPAVLWGIVEQQCEVPPAPLIETNGA